MKQDLEQKISSVIKDVFSVDTEVVLTRPDPQFGDYATNIALQISKQLGQKPRDVAQKICDRLTHDAIVETSIAGPGFINVSLSSSALWNVAHELPRQSFKNKTVVAEYSDPNPFKILHAGHLYTSVVGDSIARLLETAGATVHRVNFGGDVGLHVGKTMWAIIADLGGEHPEKLEHIEESERSNWLASCYIKGTTAYEDDAQAKPEIVHLNKSIYALHETNDHESPLAEIYWTCRQWSYDYFDAFYEKIGSTFEKYYPESAVADIGLQTVKQQLKNGVFKKSDGAVIFDGESYGLHARVFINSEGLPTYEAKDIGLIITKWNDYSFDKSVVITGSEQQQYMQVVLKAVEQFAPDLVSATTHITHGLVKLEGGTKMSSRKGNVLKAVDVIDAATLAAQEDQGNSTDEIVLGAIKYSFLRHKIGGDIVYNPKESVSMQGNSGPYLQYAHARACSIIAKSTMTDVNAIDNVTKDERLLMQKLSQFVDVLDEAVESLLPSSVCTYLYELSQEFNRFYEKNKVIGDEREQIRLALMGRYAEVLRTGLFVLGILAPEKM